MQAGYITQAQITSQPPGINHWILIRKLQNGITLISRKLSRIHPTALPTFVKSSSPNSSACLPADECRWLHLCMKKRPYATYLKPLHVCKDERQNPLTDKTFFRALKEAYFKDRTWKDWAFFKLKRIEFIGVRSPPS